MEKRDFKTSAPGMSALTYDLVLAAVLWLLIAALVMANGRQLSRPPLRPPVA